MQVVHRRYTIPGFLFEQSLASKQLFIAVKSGDVKLVRNILKVNIKPGYFGIGSKSPGNYVNEHKKVPKPNLSTTEDFLHHHISTSLPTAIFCIRAV